MGHADRSRLNDAVSVDAQSGSICLSLAGRRWHPYSNTYRDSNSDSNRYCYANFNTCSKAQS
jgi:hypothetical protein